MRHPIRTAALLIVVTGIATAQQRVGVSRPVAAQAAPKPGTAKPAPAKPVATKPIPVSTAPALKLPNIVGFTLSNGLRVWMAPNRELPSISGKLIFPAGPAYDPEGKTGVAGLVTSLIATAGSDTRSSAEVRRYLAERAAEIRPVVRGETTALSFWTLSDYGPDVLQLLGELVSTPSFDRTIFFTSKEILRRGVPQRNDSLDDVATREFTNAAFGPALAPPIELGGLEKIQREDVVAFYRSAYRPQTAQLVIGGDFDEAAMRTLLERTLGGWKPAAANPPVHHSLALAQAAGVRTANTATSASSTFQIGYPIEKISAADYAALLVLEQAIDGPPLQAVKKAPDPRIPSTVEALTAAARALDGPASLRVVGRAKLRDTVEAVRDTLAALDKVRAGQVNAADFAAARTRALRRFSAEFSRPARVLELYGEGPQDWGQPAQYLPQISAKIASLTEEELRGASARFMDPKRRVAAIAGDSRDFRTPLAVLSLPVSNANLTIAPAPPPAPPTPEQIARGAEHWKRMRTALGVDKRPVRDAIIEARGVLFTGRSDALAQHIEWLAPGTLRVDQKGEQNTTTFFDGSTTWFYDGFVTSPFSSAGVRQYRGEIFRFVHWLAARNLEPPLAVHDLGSGVIRVTDGADTVDIALNEKTGLPDTLWYIDPSSGGARAEERMLEYKEYGGVPYWSRIEVYRDGFLVGELNTVSAQFNTGLTAARIGRKPEPNENSKK